MHPQPMTCERHAADEEIPVREEAAAQVAAEEVQAVVEGAKHAHQRRGHFHRELQMLRRVENQRRVKNGEAERRKDLNEEQRGRSLRSRREKAFERFDEANVHHLRSLPRELDRPCRLIPVGSIHHASFVTRHPSPVTSAVFRFNDSLAKAFGVQFAASLVGRRLGDGVTWRQPGFVA